MPQINDNLIRFIDSSVLADQPLGMVGLEKESLRIFENSISKISHKKYLFEIKRFSTKQLQENLHVIFCRL